ncbi:MAG: hypothetical protein ABR927_08140 [Bacteroidales bacterium]
MNDTIKHRVFSKVLGHNSIKVTLDSYGIIIEELMLRNVKELKEKLSSNKVQSINSEQKEDNNAQADILTALAVITSSFK